MRTPPSVVVMPATTSTTVTPSRRSTGAPARSAAAITSRTVSSRTGRSSASLGGETEPVARAPRIRPQDEAPGLGRDPFPDERPVALEAARREHGGNAVRKRREGLAEPNVAHPADEGLGQPAGVEAEPTRERVPGLARDDGRAQPLEPPQRLVQSLPDDPLELRVAPRAFRAKPLPLPVPPDDAAREEHRPARSVALLVHDDVRSQLARPRRRHEPGHARPGDDELRPRQDCLHPRGQVLQSRRRSAQASEKLALCSTYSSLMPSGPQTK